VPKVKVAYRPHLCMHCDKAPCIEACPYDVIFFNEGLNLAQKCTAGTVYDPEEEEVVVGATCTLLQEAGPERSIKTASYGEFWFEDLPDGTFQLEMAHDTRTRLFADLGTSAADINLGDIALA
jgi:tetrathionate reductase subunit B